MFSLRFDSSHQIFCCNHRHAYGCNIPWLNFCSTYVEHIPKFGFFNLQISSMGVHTLCLNLSTDKDYTSWWLTDTYRWWTVDTTQGTVCHSKVCPQGMLLMIDWSRHFLGIQFNFWSSNEFLVCHKWPFTNTDFHSPSFWLMIPSYSVWLNLYGVLNKSHFAEFWSNPLSIHCICDLGLS